MDPEALAPVAGSLGLVVGVLRVLWAEFTKWQAERDETEHRHQMELEQLRMQLDAKTTPARKRPPRTEP